jgi:DNA-binding PadR family transcriptional regulator
MIKKKASTSLEVFLLALIDSGVETAYAMRERAALSVGATLPALRRLEKEGLVVRAKQGSRKRQAISLSAAGRRALTGDTESILRAAALAISAGKGSEGSALLRRAAKERRKSPTKRPSSIANVADNHLASIYRRMLAECDAAKVEAESKALSRLSYSMKRVR